MTFEYGLLLGIIGMITYVLGFLVAYIFIERHLKKLEEIDKEKKRKLPYDFK